MTIVVLNNTLLITMPLLVLTTEVTARQLHHFMTESGAVKSRRWLRIFAITSMLFIPASAALFTAFTGLVGAGLMGAMARSYAKVPSGRTKSLRLIVGALSLIVGALIPFLVTSRMFE